MSIVFCYFPFLFSNYYFTSSAVWSLNFFFLNFYIFSAFIVIIYLVSNVRSFVLPQSTKSFSTVTILSGLELFSFLVTPLLLLVMINFSWVGVSVCGWFGNLVWSSFQYKVIYTIVYWFVLVWVAYLTTFYYNSLEIYDYTAASYSLLLWLVNLFSANNLLTFVFFIEILSTIVTLLIITSTFSSTYFYNNITLSSHNYFSQTTPNTLLNTLLFLFWTSLIASLNLFLFLSLFYLHIFTFEWSFIEVVFLYLISAQDIKGVFTFSLVWFVLISSLFLKCGLVPFYIWKPTFFKGLPLHFLFFYVTFFYFFIFYFFLYFLIIYLSELFYFNLLVNLILLTSGLVILLFIISESIYLKAFLAMSSILNTLLIFLALMSFSVTEFVFVL